jgi:hypothetical protein
VLRRRSPDEGIQGSHLRSRPVGHPRTNTSAPTIRGASKRRMGSLDPKRTPNAARMILRVKRTCIHSGPFILCPHHQRCPISVDSPENGGSVRARLAPQTKRRRRARRNTSPHRPTHFGWLLERSTRRQRARSQAVRDLRMTIDQARHRVNTRSGACNH